MNRAGVSPVLPTEYQQCEFLGFEGDGAHLTLPFFTSTKPGAKSKVSISRRNSQLGPHLFSSNNDFFWCSLREDTGGAVKILGRETVIRSNLPLNTDINIDINSVLGVATFNNITASFAVGDTPTSGILSVGCYGGRTNQQDFWFIGKLYFLVISDGNTPMFNLLPCYRKSDGIIGMYDTISNTFFTNTGTGTFTKGADIN